METIQREDGNLLVGVFRETLFVGSGNLKGARRDLEQIAEEHGEYMLIRRVDTDINLAAATADSYLYAECLIEKFGNNFVYVEEYTENRAILVVVLDGVVRDDKIVAFDDLKDDLLTFFSEHTLDVRVSGNVPMHQGSGDGNDNIAPPANQFDTFSLPEKSVKSWETVEATLRNTIALFPKARLLPWREARNKALGSPIKKVFTIAASLAAVAVLVVSFYPKPEPPKQVEGPPPDPLAVPYAAWSSKLSMADALKVAAQVSWFSKKPNGWRAKTIKIGPRNTLVVIEQTSTFASLSAAARDFGATSIPTGGAKEITVEYPVTSTQRPRHRFDSVLANAPALRSIVDDMNYSHWGMVATVQAISKGVGYSTANVSLKGKVPVVIMEAAAKDFESRFPNTAVEAFDYDPATTSLNMTVTVFTRS